MYRVFILDKICLNVDNETDAQNLIRQGAKEIKDLSIFKGYESLVSPTNTVVNDDGSITFTAPKEKSLSELKSDKLAELSAKASSFEQTENKEMYIISSLGYKVNADPKALRNIEVLIDLGVTQFRNYDNENVEVTTDNLKTMKSEIGINSVKLYQQKWAMQDLINKAKTKEELDAIEIKFEMLDFS